MDNNSLICFDKPNFYMYITILIAVLGFLAYYFSSLKEKLADVDLYGDLNDTLLKQKMKQLKDELYQTKLLAIKCDETLSKRYSKENGETQNTFLNKIYNPLSSPEQIYPGGNFYNKGYDGYTENQMLGFITNANGQYPIMGRYHYPGKTDKFDYYTINEGRNKIKIPIKTTNYNELYDGDQVTVPELGGNFTFRKYENEGIRYNPSII
jgi:hypothetical protein